MGLGTILYQSEENGFLAGPVPTAIVRALGGDDRHLGVLGSFGTLGCLGQIFGNFLLRASASNRRAMVTALFIGVACAASLALLLLLGLRPEMRAFVLPACLGLFLLFAPINGMQNLVETSWIGDLVPRHLMGWFTKIKWMLGVSGFLLFSIGIARFSERVPGFTGYAILFGVFAASFLVAATVLYPRVSDVKPQVIPFFGSPDVRPNYRSPVLWWLMLQGLLWTAGRSIGFAFMNIYLMERFQYSLTRIALLVSLQQLISIAVIFWVGDLSDRWGSRKLLMIFMSGVALSMSLWILSAWWGIGCIIAYYVLNGAAGQTLTMLGNNYSIEVFPAKGRAAYLAVSRTLGGFAGFGIVLFSGWLVHALREFHVLVAGQHLGRHHAAFALGMIIALSSQIPFLIIGDKKIEPKGQGA